MRVPFALIACQQVVVVTLCFAASVPRAAYARALLYPSIVACWMLQATAVGWLVIWQCDYRDDASGSTRRRQARIGDGRVGRRQFAGSYLAT
jgi:hypothetical protein